MKYLKAITVRECYYSKLLQVSSKSCKMALRLCLFAIGSCVLNTPQLSSAQFLSPSNPPPVVQLAWTASASPGVTNYFLYYGTGIRQYTAKIPAGNSTNISLPLPARGPTYFFAVTAQGNGLESDFSNEVAFAPLLPPLPPLLKPVVVLTVQSKQTSANALWADAGMNWSLTPDDASKLFRLKIASAPIAALGPPLPPMFHK